MAGVFTSLLRLKDGCWNTLFSHFARWTKPLTSSLPLQTLADLRRHAQIKYPRGCDMLDEWRNYHKKTNTR
jgi:hypothetical protein